MKFKDATQLIYELVGTHSFYLTHEFVHYGASRAETANQHRWQIIWFAWGGDNGEPDRCRYVSDPTLRGVVAKLQAKVQERQQMLNESGSELECDRQRREIHDGERGVDGRRI